MITLHKIYTMITLGQNDSSRF